jgi:hypothetical protein
MSTFTAAVRQMMAKLEGAQLFSPTDEHVTDGVRSDPHPIR